MNNKVTIKTIAKMAGVSHTTVSRALNDSPLVKETTKMKIHELANELNYTPNLNAKALVEKKSFIIGVYFTDMSEGTSPSFMAEVIQRVKTALPRGYDISVDSFANLRRSNEKVNPYYDGSIVVSQATSDDEYIEQLTKVGKPLVVLNRKIERTDLYNYFGDDYAGATTATNYLLRMGHRKIAMIKGQDGFASTKLRAQAFYDVLKKNKITLPDEWVVDGNYSINSGYRAMEQILTNTELPSCVFSANDDMAMGAIRACIDYGFNVPEDISFIGFDDSAYSNFYNPRITTIRKPTKEIIQNGIQALKNLIENQTPQLPRVLSIKPALIVRNSVKRNISNSFNKNK